METIAKILRKAAFWRKKDGDGQRVPGEEYRVMVENAVQGIMVLQDGRVRYANARARGFFNNLSGELTLESLASRVHPDDRPMVLGRYAQRLRGEEVPKVYSFRVVADDGRVLWLEFSVSLIEWEGRPATLVLAEDITERRKMEAALAESEKTIRALLDASPAVEFLVGSDGKILVYNQAFERFFGRDGKPLTGRNIQDLLSPQENQVNRGKALEVLSTRKPVFFDDYQRGLWLEKSFSPILDEEGRVAKIACYGKDISERKRAAEALKESELRNRNLVEAAGISGLGIVVFKGDKRGRVFCLFANKEAQKITGYTEEELSRIPFQEIIHPNHREAASSKYWTRVGGDQEPVLYQLVVRHKKGHTVLIEISAIHTVFRGEECMIGFFRDISERKRAEKELADYRAHLEQMLEERTAQIHQLEQQRGEIEKMAATGVLAARIAHEINNPLAGIKGAFMLIKDAVPLEHQYHHYIDRIQKEINRIARIVRQMFELYRPPDEDQGEWALDQMIQDVNSLLKDECRERGVSIQFDLPPLKVRLPAGPVRQVLFNTIKNAVEASPLQGVVHIAVEKRQEKIVIRVRDQGPGISEEIRPHIFEPFYTTKRGKRGGLGLGLSISKDIVESLGGSIHFQNQSGRGVLCRIVFSHKKGKKDPKDG